METKERFEKLNDDYGKFERVVNKKSTRPDIHAFILLDELFPYGNRDIVRASIHGEIYLDVSDDQIDSLTDDDILRLVRCGVMHNGGGLYMLC